MNLYSKESGNSGNPRKVDMNALATYVSYLRCEMEQALELSEREKLDRDDVLQLALDQQLYMMSNVPDSPNFEVAAEIDKYHNVLDSFFRDFDLEEGLSLVTGYYDNLKEMIRAGERKAVDSLIEEQQSYIAPMFLSATVLDLRLRSVLAEYFSCVADYQREQASKLRSFNNLGTGIYRRAYESGSILNRKLSRQYRVHPMMMLKDF